MLQRDQRLGNVLQRGSIRIRGHVLPARGNGLDGLQSTGCVEITDAQDELLATAQLARVDLPGLAPDEFEQVRQVVS